LGRWVGAEFVSDEVPVLPNVAGEDFFWLGGDDGPSIGACSGMVQPDEAWATAEGCGDLSRGGTKGLQFTQLAGNGCGLCKRPL
jgi:hypothetical protein